MKSTFAVCGLSLALAVAVACGCSNNGGGGGPSPDPGPTTSDPGTADPGTADPGTADPGIADPGTPDPGTPDPGAADAGGDWGTLRGRFVYDGDPPPAQPQDVTKDVAFCTKKHPPVETLVVDPASKGVANIVFGLYLKRGAKPPTPHESYAEKIKQPLKVDNKWCRFEPHVTVVHTGQPVMIGNGDEVGHNTRAEFIKNPSFNETIAAGSSIEKVFSEVERLPSEIACNIHPWMRGYLVIKDHPYITVSGTDGSFTIENLPVGEWEFLAWHEAPGYVTDVTLGGKKTEWSRGRFKYTIKGGDNDLGTIAVPPDSLKNS